MYGLVNRALEELIRNQHGDTAWEAIKARAGVKVEVFTRMDGYPDSVTYSLVDAAVEVLGIPGDELLKAFGRQWTLYTGREGYGPLLASAGSSLKDMLMGLDDLHLRVGLMYPDLKPPSFRCETLDEKTIELHYHSTRAGLGPMVIGLVEGLAQHFAQPVSIRQHLHAGAGSDHDSFIIVMGETA